MPNCAILILALAVASLAAAEAYPLWDGEESVAHYTQRVNLPATKSLDLGNGVKMELVLIPAGKFMMGTPEPVPVDEHEFRTKIIMGKAILAASVGALLVMFGVVIARAMRERQRPKVSLARFMAVIVLSGAAVLGQLHWRIAQGEMEAALLEFASANARFQEAGEPEKPGHPVTLTHPFYMGRYAVTEEQWQAVMGARSNEYNRGAHPLDPFDIRDASSEPNGKDHPVAFISWHATQEFCSKMTEKIKHAVRLPTEAEWEFACTAGTVTSYYSGDTLADLSRVGWHAWNSNRSTHPVGQKAPNAFGLYDMHGNVWQWCSDWHQRFLSSMPAQENPQGPAEGLQRIMRGGSFRCAPSDCGSRWRYSDTPDTCGESNGFRVVVPVPSL